MSYDIAVIGKRIKELRGIIGFSLEEMARAAGISRESYLEYEEGKKDFPFSFLFNCSEKFGVDLVELVMAMEEEFDVGEIDEEDLAGLKTVRDCVQYLNHKINS